MRRFLDEPPQGLGYRCAAGKRQAGLRAELITQTVIQILNLNSVQWQSLGGGCKQWLMQRGAAFYQGSRHRTHWSSSAQLSPRHIAAARTTWFWLHLVQPSSNGTLFPLRAEVSLLYQIIFRLFHMNSTCTVKAVSSHPFLRRKKKNKQRTNKTKNLLGRSTKSCTFSLPDSSPGCLQNNMQ